MNLTEPNSTRPTPRSAAAHGRKISEPPVSGILVASTVRVKLAWALLLAASVAVHDTVVVPTESVEPDAGVQTIVAAPELSLAVGTAYLTDPRVPTGKVTF